MKLLLGLALALVTATAAMAQHDHSSDVGHTSSGAKESGQSAFAAIAEIVGILKDDPTTDWSRVDIETLRQHLIDMELVTIGADVSTERTPQGAIFSVTGNERTLRGIMAMVPAHAPFLEGETGWDVLVTEVEGGVLMRVEGNPAQIQALGFIGLMTIGAHHQEHHLMMAKGNVVH
ncbi:MULTISPECIES: hypothetical protein [Litoreibacter]|uniref:DinB-like domain-containing protein n=1 Tax=Litoreibacter ascidiaceicola TaxID=1486859 RepID=A0A1M5DJN5_9RHOB|nr:MULTISPECIES: hypothetical protein [Litoreibacter]SHF67104.1 hypothetical protein SAMN05444273_10972 [Litoreibacter ascidiaceicola]